jgi:hypothetical protein
VSWTDGATHARTRWRSTLLELLTEVYEFGRIAFGLPVTVVDPETGEGENGLVRVSDVFVVAWVVYDG